jgi:hypothetical protein
VWISQPAGNNRELLGAHLQCVMARVAERSARQHALIAYPKRSGRPPAICSLTQPDLPRSGLVQVTLRDMNDDPNAPPPPGHQTLSPSTPASIEAARVDSAPVFTRRQQSPATTLRDQIGEACQAWLARSPSMETRSGYRDRLRKRIV